MARFGEDLEELGFSPWISQEGNSEKRRLREWRRHVRKGEAVTYWQIKYLRMKPWDFKQAKEHRGTLKPEQPGNSRFEAV